jgi:cysteine sulfinate desulfinase/cysteine desulfurase-like protein
MGVSQEIGRSAVRFSLGRFTQKTEIDRIVDQILSIMKRGQ